MEQVDARIPTVFRQLEVGEDLCRLSGFRRFAVGAEQ